MVAKSEKHVRLAMLPAMYRRDDIMADSPPLFSLVHNL